MTVTSCTFANSMGEFPLFHPCQHLILSGCFALAINISSSVYFSCSVVSNSLQPHESQHARPPCPSPTPRVHSTHVHQVGDAIQPSHPLSFPSPPAPTSSQHQGLLWRGQSIGVSASVLPMNILSWFTLGLTGLTSLLSRGLSMVVFLHTYNLFLSISSLF